ncbi:MAG: head-tail connector protein [Ruminococcus sp.]
MDIVRVDSLESYKTDHYTKTAVMYATAYLYEHREDADHHTLTLTLRSLLFGNRREVF